jgi:hypothetical protein
MPSPEPPFAGEPQSTTAAYYEIAGQPFVTLTGKACIALSQPNARPSERLMMLIRRGAARQIEIDAVEKRETEGEWLTVRETAEELGITPRAVRSRCQKRQLMAKHLGNRWLIYAGDAAFFQ